MDERERIGMLRQMPKVDLHLHLDGSVRPETVIEWAGQAGSGLPAGDVEGVARLMKVQGRCGSLAEYLEKFHFSGTFLQTGEALSRAAYEVVEQSAGENCVYIEVRFAPQLHRQKGLTAEEAIEAVLDGLARGERDFGVIARGIVCCMRGHTERLNVEAVEAAARFYGKGIVAVDLAGDEARYPSSLYGEVFRRALRFGMPVTIHAGEAGGAGNIEDAIRLLGASRIGHGIRLRENERLLEFVRERQIPLEICPTSNIQTHAVDDWASHPLREYFDRGLAVTVNTDNLTVSDTTITREYESIMRHYGFTMQELGRLVLQAVSAAFLPEGEKRQLHRKVRNRLEPLAGAPNGPKER